MLGSTKSIAISKKLVCTLWKQEDITDESLYQFNLKRDANNNTRNVVDNDKEG